MTKIETQDPRRLEQIRAYNRAYYAAHKPEHDAAMTRWWIKRLRAAGWTLIPPPADEERAESEAVFNV